MEQVQEIKKAREIKKSLSVLLKYNLLNSIEYEEKLAKVNKSINTISNIVILDYLEQADDIKANTKKSYLSAIKEYMKHFDEKSKMLDVFYFASEEELAELYDKIGYSKMCLINSVISYLNEHMQMQAPIYQMNPPKENKKHISEKSVKRVGDLLDSMSKVYLYIAYYVLIPKNKIYTITFDMIDLKKKNIVLDGFAYKIPKEAFNVISDYYIESKKWVIQWNQECKRGKERDVNGNIFQHQKSEVPYMLMLRRKYCTSFSKLIDDGILQEDDYFTIDDAVRSRILDLRQTMRPSEIAETFNIPIRFIYTTR